MIPVRWSELRDRLKQTISLKELVEEYTVLTPAGNNVWSGRCPHPDHEDKNPSFRLFKNKDGSFSFKCFGCQDIYAKKGQNGNYGTDIFAFLQWMSDHKNTKKVLTFVDTLNILAERAGFQPVRNEQYAQAYDAVERQVRKAQTQLTQGTLQYLYRRGLSDEDIADWRIGEEIFLENNYSVPRITFPLYDESKRPVGFSSRVIVEDPSLPKYKNSKVSDIFQKGSCFFGIQFLDLSEGNIVITEGQFDVILARKMGVKNVVAVLGSSFTDDHALFVQKKKLFPVFAFDGDIAGQKAVFRALSVCKEHKISADVCVLPQDKDLADVALEKQKQLPVFLQLHSIPSWQYELTEVALRYDAELQDIRKRVMPLIKKAMPVTENDQVLMKTFVKERFGILL